MTGNVSAEVSQDVQRRKTMTTMQKRDLQDAMSLAVSTLGTAISIVALVMANPRSDPDVASTYSAPRTTAEQYPRRGHEAGHGRDGRRVGRG